MLFAAGLPLITLSLGSWIYFVVAAARDWFLREQFRLFSALDPGRALHTGVGRPDIARPYDDGGLIDVNHVGAADLVRHAKLKPPVAERVVASRHQDGWFRRPDDLVHRGLVPAKTYRRLAARLIALPPA